MATLHAYVHVPFCRVRCGYCDFNTYTATELEGFSQSDFVNQFAKELEISKSVLGTGRELETIFFGGGTPTQLPATDLVGVLALLRDSFGIAKGAEVTTEANPDNVDGHYLEALREGGFNRISFGMQSAVPSVLETLERTHTPANVPKSVRLAKELEFETSVDLIYGAPKETMDEWKRSVDAAIELETDHISAYALIVEDGTKLARQIKRGELPEPDEDLQAAKYEWADAQFASAGLNWYELSNWSRSKETESAHNVAYWVGNDWWGYGPGAHSHLQGERWWNVKHPSAYAGKLAEGLSPEADRETLTEEQKFEERVLLESRLATGLDLSVIENKEAVAGLIADGLIYAKSAINGRLVLTLQGRLLADLVVRRLV
ncbi:MAG: radical SAM family heme chaperone HemW [Rhodoluna sp.]|nr:radical SAM family heme chaperone HemW [Rhodoluna sp.]